MNCWHAATVARRWQSMTSQRTKPSADFFQYLGGFRRQTPMAAERSEVKHREDLDETLAARYASGGRPVGGSQPGHGSRYAGWKEKRAGAPPKACPRRLVQCRYCHSTVVFADRESHEDGCSMLPLACRYCGEVRPKSELALHENSHCARRPVECTECKAQMCAAERAYFFSEHAHG